MTSTGPQKGRNAPQTASYHRAYHVRTRQRNSLLIPVPVLAAALREQTSSPLVEHLGPEMVEAIHEATEDAA